jgi:enoyl-[acyl-carrier-protein] reductase (NADH)
MAARNTAVKTHRRIQKQVARADKKRPRRDTEAAMQAGARDYPAPPFPKQHLSKPGTESNLNPAPMYDAPYYQGSGKLRDKVALITGGDSGIGRAVAVLFAREGADVALMYLDEDSDAAVTKTAVEAEGRRCIALAGDVSKRSFCRKAVRKTVDAFGKLDILVNNAAFQLHVSRSEDLTEQHFDRTLKTNLYGYFHMCQEALEVMKYGGAIVNTGSVTGLLGNKALLDYSLTKGGIHAYKGGYFLAASWSALARSLPTSRMIARAISTGMLCFVAKYSTSYGSLPETRDLSASPRRVLSSVIGISLLQGNAETAPKFKACGVPPAQPERRHLMRPRRSRMDFDGHSK